MTGNDSNVYFDDASTSGGRLNRLFEWIVWVELPVNCILCDDHSSISFSKFDSDVIMAIFPSSKYVFSFHSSRDSFIDET